MTFKVIFLTFLVVFILKLENVECDEYGTPPWALAIYNASMQNTQTTIKLLKLLGPNFVNSWYNLLGQQECAGFDQSTGLNLFGTIWNGYDFGGNSVCNISCGGTCEPYESITNDAPISAYPFGCNCDPSRCTANGPLPPSYWPFPLSLTSLTCLPNAGCDSYCNTNFGPANPEGFLCNWWNLGDPFNVNIDPLYSPIRWCECCPHF